MRRRQWLLNAAGMIFWVLVTGMIVVKVRQRSALRPPPPKMLAAPVRRVVKRALPIVKVETVAPGRLEEQLTLMGALEPAAIETALPQVNGRVVKVFVKSGGVVKSGDVVVQLDRTSLQRDVKFTKTLLAQTQARVDALTSERSNARTSLEKATQELQAAQLEITAAQGEIAQAEAALQKLRQRPDAPSPPIVTPPVTSSTNEERVAAQAAVRAAELNVGQARVAFEQSEAARARAQTDFALADKDFLRGQKLFDAGAVSRRFFESKQELHAAAQKKLEQTTEQWKERRTRLAQAEETLKQAQNRLHQARTQEPAPPVETNPQTTVRNPPSSDVAEVAAVVKQARERAAHAAARAKASREVYETAQQRVAEVEATWQALTQQVTDAQETLSNKAVLVGAADIHAPCDGVVTQIAAQVGDKVTAGTPLVFVAPPDKWRARFSLSLEATLLIKPQMTVPVALPLADGRTKEFVGTVERVIPLESVTAISVADVLITTEGASVSADASATCALSLGQREDVLTVPAEAVHQDGEKTTVYIVQSQGAKHVAQMREVRLGWTDGSRYEVVDGLSAGEQVVIESASLLHEGDVVRIE